jgi:hypothetical protein
MTSRVFVSSVLAAVAIVALAGCSVGSLAGGTQPAGGSPTSSSKSSAKSPASGASSGSGGSSAADFPCNLYSLSAISDLAGFKVVQAQEITAVNQPDQKSCEYTTADGSHTFATEIALSNGPAHLQIWTQIENTGGPVSGVGDSAWGDDSDLAATFGNVYVEAGDESDASDDSVKLANIGLNRLTLMVESLHAATLKG